MLILRTNLLLFVISFVTQLIVTHAATNRQTPERIFGGQPAADHQFAYQVSLRYAGDNVHFCSGSILSQRWIVSAGHCVFYADAESVVAVVGSQQRNSSIASDVDGRPGAYAIERLVVHAAYGHLSMRNDIALLRTAREMIMSGQVAPVGLDSDGHFVGAGWVVWASGWMSDLCAATSSTVNSIVADRHQLQYLDLVTLTNLDCQARHPVWHHMVDETSSLCAYAMSPLRGICDGDAGSPLVVRSPNDGRTTVDTWRHDARLVGLLSWSDPFVMGRPDVFTRISPFVPWILEHVNGEFVSN